MAQIQLDHLYKIYKGNVEAVKDLNLTIRDGEFLALLGPSGCGKTSTLRMIVGLEEISKGTITIGNRVVNKLEPAQRNVALAFESYALYPPLSIRDNISFCLRARKMARAEIDTKVQEVARILDITDILDRKPAELGGGQKQRVSLARALVRDPDVLLLDEPLSHLDAAQRAHMRTELKRLHAQIHHTTVLVTHDQLEAIAMAERIAIMNFGVLQQVGTFDEVYNHPVNEFVAGFIGEPPMNFLPCRPVAQGDQLDLQATDGSFRLTLPSELRSRVLTKSPATVTLGIRPVHIDVAGGPVVNGQLSIEKSVVPTVAGKVSTYESLGEEGQLAATVGKSTVLVVTSPGQQLQRGEPVTLQLRSERLHLFDSASQVAL